MHFFKILFSNVFHNDCDILVWNWSYTMNILSAVWLLMVWFFSTRAAVATLLITHPCVSSCLWVNHGCSQISVTRSWRTVILSTSLKLRTYLNLRTPVLKFKYDCNPRLLSSYCKITFENLCSTKWIPHDDVVSMNSHLVDRKRNRWHPDIIVKNKINHSSAQKT